MSGRRGLRRSPGVNYNKLLRRNRQNERGRTGLAALVEDDNQQQAADAAAIVAQQEQQQQDLNLAVQQANQDVNKSALSQVKSSLFNGLEKIKQRTGDALRSVDEVTLFKDAATKEKFGVTLLTVAGVGTGISSILGLIANYQLSNRLAAENSKTIPSDAVAAAGTDGIAESNQDASSRLILTEDQIQRNNASIARLRSLSIALFVMLIFSIIGIIVFATELWRGKNDKNIEKYKKARDIKKSALASQIDNLVNRRSSQQNFTNAAGRRQQLLSPQQQSRAANVNPF